MSSDKNVEIYDVCKIDEVLFSCISNDIRTNEVIISAERISHIKEHHPHDYERFHKYIVDTIKDPDYILKANRANTGVLLKEIEVENVKVKLILKIVTSFDNPNYKNSIISFWKIDDNEWRRLVKNKEILYKKEENDILSLRKDV